MPPTSPQTPVEPAPAASVAGAVAADLESIFAPTTVRPPRRRAGLHGGRAQRPHAARRGGRAARLGALLAAACVGLSAGALLSRPRNQPEPAAPAQLAIIPAPAARPVLPLPQFVDTSPAPSAPVVDAVRKASTPQRARPHRKATPVSSPCGPRARCGHAQVMAADARLRRAYSGAIRAGVPNPVLRDYRDRWSSLRRHARQEPKRVVVGYRKLAIELDRHAARERRVAYAPPHDNGWRRLRTDISDLWR